MEVVNHCTFLHDVPGVKVNTSGFQNWFWVKNIIHTWVKFTTVQVLWVFQVQ